MDSIELVAAALGIVYILLQYKANAWMWVFSFAMSTMYIFVNLQHGLYANCVLQIIFSVMAVVGLLHWVGLLRHRSQRPITSMPHGMVVPLIVATVVMAAAIVAILLRQNESSLPYFDGITMAINLTGTFMLIRKYYQEWICWMIVDPLMCAMYAIEGMWPSAILYALYSAVVVFGYIHWKRQSKLND